MSKIVKVLTDQHLKASRAMPRKEHPLWLGEKENKKYRARAKTERRLIAMYYKLRRSNPLSEDGGSCPRRLASLAHRHRVVTTGAQARIRLMNTYPEELWKPGKKAKGILE